MNLRLWTLGIFYRRGQRFSDRINMCRKDFWNSAGKVAVIGAGKSGLAACSLAVKLGKKVKLSERGSLKPEVKDYLRKLNVEIEENGHSFEFLSDCGLVIVSPGVDLSGPFFRRIAGLGLPIVGEVELAYWFCPAYIVAVTGTNGKTTTVSLLAEVLRLTNRNVYALGNIGVPFSGKVLDLSPQDIVCLELSSFQLETIKYFRPGIACFLNISSDHLDRHKGFSAYLQAKKKIFANQTSEDYAVFPEGLAENFPEVKARKILIKDYTSSRDLNQEFVLAAAKIFDLPEGDILRKIEEFGGLAHRLEKVISVSGVDFYNDSKATNPASTIWALEKLKGNIILIAGGRDKDMDFSVIKHYAGRLKKIILLGEAARKISRVFAQEGKCLFAEDLKQAVNIAYSYARPADKVLLSPMCASFDMFKDYRERGDLFKEYVRSLQPKKL